MGGTQGHGSGREAATPQIEHVVRETPEGVQPRSLRFKFDPNEDGAEFSWSYEGIILHSDKQILADFALLSKSCFGGKLIVYFLN